MFQQFRTHYPTGSIISELLESQPGNYIVRIILQVDGLPLAMALGGADTVELAEDRARKRAWDLLNDLSTETPKIEPETVKPIKGNGASQLDVSVPRPTSGINQENPSVGPISTFKPLSQGASLSLPPLDKVSPSDSFAWEEKTRTQNLSSNTEPTPIDMSDVIAQTSIEIKRLQWTEEQGREYLKQTYGKRSRQHLTDEELVNFLHYLQQQPSP